MTPIRIFGGTTVARGVLFIGGAGPAPSFLRHFLRPDDIVCAADSGLDAALAAGIRPHGVVGDMDSLSDTFLLADFPADAVETHPEDKDHTDTELGLAWLERRGAKDIALIGGGEGRIDHTLALIGLFGNPSAPDRWYTALEEIRPVAGNIRIEGVPGSAVSFAPVGPGPWAASSVGLRWELDDVIWARGTVSLSNRLVESTATVDVSEGILLVIRPLQAIR